MRFLSLIFLASILAAEESPLPEPWEKAYDEAMWYHKTRDDIFTDALLGLDEQGTINIYNLTEWQRSHITFKNGVQRLSRGPDRKLTSHYGKGNYVLVMNGHTGLSYCYSSNPVYFQITEKGDIALDPPMEETSIDRFPNPWYFVMANYQSWKMRNRFNLGDENLVKPSVELEIDNQTGTITRTKLDPSFETSLHWLVYRDGKLISEEKASGVQSIRLKAEPDSPTVAFTVLVAAKSGEKKLLVSRLSQYCHTSKTGWIHLPFWSPQNRKYFDLRDLGL